LLQIKDDPDRLVRVELPSGDVTTVVDALNLVRPLGNRGALLLTATGSSRNDTSVYDGREARTLFSGDCHYTAAPDGTRIYAVGSCVGKENGLVALDVATGKPSVVDKRAALTTVWQILVSPNGKWVAYTEGDSDVNNRTITVASAAGNAYTIASAPGVYLVDFASDDLLIFQTGGKADLHGDLRGHTPGSGDTSFVIASDRFPGYGYPYTGYQFSPDRTRILAAKMPGPSDTPRSGALFSIPLHGGDPTLLLADWAYPLRDMTDPFAFDSQGKYAVYVSTRNGDLTSFSVWAVDMQGSSPRKLSDGWGFGLTHATSSVVLYDNADKGRFRVRLTDLATGRDRLSYSSSAQILSAAAFRGDQAVLFSEDGVKRRAGFMSVSHPEPIVLGEWTEPSSRGVTRLPVYPDPTGCFTVINTDLPTGTGTRLVLLPE
jgi:hypothetical protein